MEYGLARIKMGENVIDESLPITAAWNWFDIKGSLQQYTLLDHLRRHINHAPRGNGFKAYLAFYFRKVFEKGAKLDDVFTFRSDFALRKKSDLSWQKERFELVALSAPAGTHQVSLVTPSRGPCANIGFEAESDDDVVDWISENKGSYAFCFPTELAGPDMYFYIRSKVTGGLLLVALQAKHYEVAK
jgi:hypothetical protein